MIGFQMKQVGPRPPSAAKIESNLRFGVAKGLTETAKQGQAAVLGALRGTFTLRGSWYQQSNRFGIRVKPATKVDMTAEVRTMADWLEKHETGGTKTARGGRVAIPTDQVRRNKRQIITRPQRPRNLKNTFILQTDKGPVLAQRLKRGKRKGVIILYGLEQRVRIRKQPTFFEPITKVVNRRLNRNIYNGIDYAMKTMK